MPTIALLLLGPYSSHMEEPPINERLLDIVTRHPKVHKNRGRRVSVDELTDEPNRLRLTVVHDERGKGKCTVDNTYVIDCRNRAAVEHVMKEIRRLMEELDGLVL